MKKFKFLFFLLFGLISNSIIANVSGVSFAAIEGITLAVTAVAAMSPSFGKSFRYDGYGLDIAIPIPPTAPRPMNRPAGSAIPMVNNAPANIAIPQFNHFFTDPTDHKNANTSMLEDAYTIQVVSAKGAGTIAATKTFLLNRDLNGLNNITNNGSGAASITYTEQDGSTLGGIGSAIIALSRAGVGGVCYGLEVRSTVGSASLSSLNLTWVTFDFFGNPVPRSFNTAKNTTRKDFDTTVIIIPMVQNITRTTQLQFTTPLVADTLTFTFFFTPNFAR